MSFLRYFSRPYCVLLLAALLTQAHAQSLSFKEQESSSTITLSAGMYLIKAEVAANEADRAQGLMFRQKLGSNEGMLFVFDQIASHCFWMKNTPMPLSIAFIDAHGMVTDIDEMQADSMALHCPSRAGRYALEMQSGWFLSKGIKPGVFIRGLPH